MGRNLTAMTPSEIFSVTRPFSGAGFCHGQIQIKRLELTKIRIKLMSPNNKVVGQPGYCLFCAAFFSRGIFPNPIHKGSAGFAEPTRHGREESCPRCSPHGLQDLLQLKRPITEDIRPAGNKSWTEYSIDSLGHSIQVNNAPARPPSADDWKQTLPNGPDETGIVSLTVATSEHGNRADNNEVKFAFSGHLCQRLLRLVL